MPEGANSRTESSVAVVGVACRFPDADDASGLLDVVLAGRRAFRRLPPGRLNLAEYYRSDPTTSDATYSSRAALLEGWRFDRAAFGIDQAVYHASDPAHWLALETAARALAAAGLPAGAGLDRDRTGVIIGNTLAGDSSRANALRLRWPYVRRALTEALDAAAVPIGQAGTVLRRAERRFLAPFPAIGPQSLAGSMPATIAATISSYFGFRGGSHAVDSACSSSLQAVASACTALAAGDLDAAIAGGVDLSLDPLELIGLAKAGLLAATDVRLYDERPTGYLPGEGCGAVILLRTADARAAGLPIYAEILGWGTSSGGLPGEPPSQASSQLLAMRRAYDRAGVDPAEIDYIEGNGAATLADDEAELTALASIRAAASRTAALGSVKANIGHTKAAAGVAGLIKTVLVVSTGVLPPATGVERPHSLIAGGDARVLLPPAARDWGAGPRLAAVSATGIGGSNVHLVLRHEVAGRLRVQRSRPAAPEPTSPPMTVGGPGPWPFLLHAPDRASLAATLSRLADRAAWLSDSELQDLACALGRNPAEQGPARVALVAARQEQLAAFAREALGILPLLAEGRIATRPGIFASDGADGRLLLLLSGEPPVGGATGLRSVVGHCMDMLRWLDSLEVAATVAVGHGFGLLAGLAWAGVLGEPEVLEICALRARFLETAVARGADITAIDAASDWPPVDGTDATAMRAAIAKRFRLGPPRRRLISTVTGAPVRSIDEAVDVICGGFAGADLVAEAVADAAVGATLLIDTGPGQALKQAAASVRAPLLSLRPGFADPVNLARVAAALFAAGALGDPQPLFAGQHARPIDIWREPVFLASPCEPAPRQRRPPEVAGKPPEDAVATAPMPVATDSQPRRRPGADRTAAEALRTAIDAVARSGADRTAAEALRTATDAVPRSGVDSAVADAVTPAAASVPGPAADAAADGRHLPGGVGVPASPAAASVNGLAPWSRCFTEGLRPAPRPQAPEPTRSWRVYAAARSPRLADLGRQFAADPAARQTLAVLEDPADEQSRSAAVAAAHDAASTGELVVITTSAGFTGFFATLHAEQPSIGVTVLRVPAEATSPAAILAVATAEPGRFRELVIAPDGSASEPVLTEVPLSGGAGFPLGPDDVLVISRATGGAGLALARVLACNGTGIAMVGRAAEYDDTELIAGLEELRSAGARIGYEIVDIGDPASLAAAFRRIEGRLGPVTAIAHAASPSEPVAVLDIADAAVRSHPADQVGVLEALAGSIPHGQLKLIISFGSVAGRYGLAGTGLFALGCGALVSRVAELAAARADCQALHVDLPAWSTRGLGERPDLAAQLASAGTPALDVSVASRLLLKLLTTPGLPARLALHGRVGGLASGRPPVITASELATAGLPRGGRFLREVAVFYPGVELICTARLSLASDPFLADYRVDGQPALPPVLALEALAQAASVLAGRPVRQAGGVTLDSPVLVPLAAETTVRVCAQRDGDTITAALRSSDSSYRIDHAVAVFRCEQPEEWAAAVPVSSPPRLAAATTGLVDGTELYGPVCFQSGRFRRIALLPEVTARSGRAIARGDDDQPWFASGNGLSDTGLLLGSPGLNDAMLQLLQACVPNRRVRPTGCELMQFSGRDESGPVEIRAVAEPVPTTEALQPVLLADSADGAVGPAPVVPGQPGAPAAEQDECEDSRDAGSSAPGPASGEALADQPASASAGRARAQSARSRHAGGWRVGARQRHATLPTVVAGAVAGEPAAAPDENRALRRDLLAAELQWTVQASNAVGQLIACWRGVRLRDAGPLPNNEAWPPALLAAFLERSTTELGLDEGLRVSVSCGQPAVPADAIPRQSGPGRAGPGGVDGPADQRHTRPRRNRVSAAAAARGGPLAGFTLAVQAPVPATCGWVTIDEARRQHQPAAALAIAYGQLRAELPEPPPQLAGRLEAVRACLAAAGLPADSDLRVIETAGDGWVVLATRRARIACTVVGLSGVAAPVAVALLTTRGSHARAAPARAVAAVGS
jgi:enediyne polyketide synthase